MLINQIRREKLDLEGAVVLKKSAQQVRLVPCSAFIDPVARVFERIEDVMEMDVDAFLQERQDLKDDVIHVAARFGNVRRIDKQNIREFQFSKDADVYVLNRLAQYPDLPHIRLPDQSPQQLRIWINECAPNGIIEKQFIHIQHGAGRVSRPYFNDPPWPQMPHH